MSDEIGYLAEAISRQSVESAAWLFLTAYSKIKKERKIKDGSVKQKRSRNSQIHNWKGIGLRVNHTLILSISYLDDI